MEINTVQDSTKLCLWAINRSVPSCEAIFMQTALRNQSALPSYQTNIYKVQPVQLKTKTSASIKF